MLDRVGYGCQRLSARAIGHLASIASCLVALAGLHLSAQFTVEGYPVQVHGFVSQGFAYSNDNNYLTMNTSEGSFQFTDAGLNVSSQITDSFRIGAQAYVRSIGELGSGHVTLDWALGDYRFTNWFGIRAGKVKTVIGLYNDTQDEGFLHTWALLPQSLYPLDLRETSIAHTGADLYGTIPLHQAGDLSYTVYAGKLPEDRSGGYNYGLRDLGLNPRTINQSERGANLKWTTPLTGLLLNASFVNTPGFASGINVPYGNPYEVKVYGDKRVVFSAQYTLRNLRIEGEYSREIQKLSYSGVIGPAGSVFYGEYDRRAWYAAIAYRFSKHLELGTYNSRFFPNADRADWQGPGLLPPPERHIFDQVVTARIDLTKFWDFKIEGHFINGYGDPTSFRGFYPENNPLGFQPSTNLLILRMGVNF